MLAGLDKFDAAVKGWFASVEEAASEAAVGLAHEAFEQILENGAQATGDFVSNTNVSVGKPDFSFEEGRTPPPFAALTDINALFKRGDPAAQEEARKRAVWTTPKLGESVFIASNAVHDEPYSVALEEGKINLRPVNQGADHVYAKAASHVQHRYAKIGKLELAALRKKP